VRDDVVLERQPVGDDGVVALPRARGGHLDEGLPLEVVLEDVLLVAGERAVGQAQEVILVDEADEHLADRRGVGRHLRVPDLRRRVVLPVNGEERAEPEHAPHRRRPLEEASLLGAEPGDARLDRVLDREGQAHELESLGVDRPALLAGGVGRRLEDTVVVKDAHHLLEQRGVASRERARRVDEIVDALPFTTGSQELVHHRGRVGIGERREIDHRMARVAVLQPAVAPDDELGARDRDHEDGGPEAVDQRGEEIERLVLRRLQVIEDEDQRARRLSHAGGAERLVRRRRVLLPEALDDRAAQEVHLLRVRSHGLDERRVLELEVEELAEEVGDVADLPVLEHDRQLGADLVLGSLGGHPLCHTEARTEEPPEDAAGHPLVLGRAAEDARRGRSRGPVDAPEAHEKLANEARLSDARSAEHRDRPARARLLHDGERVLEGAHLGRTPHQQRAPLADREAGAGGEALMLSHAMVASPGQK